METADHDRFAAELQSLKTRGCSILVVEPPCETARCSDLLGEDNQDRKRVVVAGDRREPPVGPAGRVVDAGSSTVRSASAATAERPARKGEPALDTIAADVREAVSEFDVDELQPGELRVCCGDLEVLATKERDDGDSEEVDVETYVRTVTDSVTAAGGMSHAHLPATSPLRESIEPHVDITVEVRSTPEGRQQRWVLHDADLDSGWLAIDS